MITEAYIINLPSRPDRRRMAQMEFRNLGLNITPKVFPAIDVRGMGFERHKGAKDTMNPGALGCTLSHMAILQIAATYNQQAILICEDDFVVKGKMKWFALNSAPRNWDILVLGWGVWRQPMSAHRIIRQIDDFWCISDNAAGTYCMIVNNPQRVLSVLAEMPHNVQLDHVISNAWHERKLNVYHYIEPVITHNDELPSDAN